MQDAPDSNDRRAFVRLLGMVGLGAAAQTAFGQTLQPASGPALWASIPDRFETERNFPRTAFGADAAYHLGRQNLTEALSALDRDMGRNPGPWIGGGAKDYVAGQAGAKIETIVRTFEAETGLRCTTPFKNTPRFGTGLSYLQAAVSRAEIMASPALAEKNFGRPLYKDGKPFWDFARAFDLAAANIFNVLHKVSAIQEKAGWVHQGSAVHNDAVDPTAPRAANTHHYNGQITGLRDLTPPAQPPGYQPQ